MSLTKFLCTLKFFIMRYHKINNDKHFNDYIGHIELDSSI